MINHKFKLENAFQEILYLIDNWINKASGWIVESIESQYINISPYRPLSGSYVKIACRIKKSEKRTNNIKNEDQVFLWCHVRHINPVKIHPERITKVDKKLVEDLDYGGVEFPVQEKDLNKTETKNTICIYVFWYENGRIFPIYVSEEIFGNLMDFLLVFNDDKSHYVYIKDSNRFVSQNKNKQKKFFIEVSYSVLGVKMC